MMGVLSSKEVMQRPKSTGIGEELNLSCIQKAAKNRKSTFPNFFLSRFCLCFAGRGEEEKNPENGNKKSFLPGEFKYPASSSKASKIIEEEHLLEEINEQELMIKKRRPITLSADFFSIYPANQLFFLQDASKKLILISKISPIEHFEKKTSRVSSKVTKSMTVINDENQEDFSPEIKNIRASQIDKCIAYLFNRTKKGFFLLITGKEPQDHALKSLKKNEQFLLTLLKSDRPSKPTRELHSFQSEVICSNSSPLPRKALKCSFDLVILDCTSLASCKPFFLSNDQSKASFQQLSLQIQEAFLYSQNLVLIVPGMLHLEWVLTLFAEQKNAYSIEIESFSGFSKNIELLLIYYGQFNNITKKDTLEHMSAVLNRDCTFHKNQENINHFLGHLTGKMGFRRVFRYMMAAEEKKCCKITTLFQKFLDLMREKGKISLEEQQEFLSHESKHDKNNSFFEHCSAFSFNKKRKKSEHQPFSPTEKTPNFDASLMFSKKEPRKSKIKAKDSNNSNVSRKEKISYTESWLENMDLGSSTDSNRILEEFEPRKEVKKGQNREKSV